MHDSLIHRMREKLVADDHELCERQAAGNASESDRQRLSELKVPLNQRWELLHQHRACGAGRVPEGDDLGPGVVERYEQ